MTFSQILDRYNTRGVAIIRDRLRSSSEWNGYEIKHILGNSHSTGPTRRREVFERSIRNTFTIKKWCSWSYHIPSPWTTSDDGQNEFSPITNTNVDRRNNAFWLRKKIMPLFFNNEWHYTWSLIWTGYGGFLKTLSVRFRCIMTWINAKLKKNGLDRLETACNPSFRILRAKQRK